MKTALVGYLTAFAALSVGGGAIPAVAAARSESAAQKPTRILVLYDENKDDFPGLARTDSSLRKALRAGLEKVEIYSESMNLSLPRGAGYESQHAAALAPRGHGDAKFTGNAEVGDRRSN